MSATETATTEEVLAAAAAANADGMKMTLRARAFLLDGQADEAIAAGNVDEARRLRDEAGRMKDRWAQEGGDTVYEPPAPVAPPPVGTYDEIDHRLLKGEITVDEASAEKTALMVAKMQQRDDAALAEVRTVLEVDDERDARIATFEETRQLYPDEFKKLGIRDLQKYDEDVASREVERIAAERLIENDRLYGRSPTDIDPADRLTQVTGSVNAARDVHASMPRIAPLAPAARERLMADQRMADIAEHAGTGTV